MIAVQGVVKVPGSSIVKSICRKYGVSYKHISYWELVSSQVRAWKKYSAAGFGLVALDNASLGGQATH